MEQLKKVAIIDGSRIPFCRSGSAYADTSNKAMMTQALKGIVDKQGLHGETLGEVILGAVVKHARDFSLARECTVDAGLSYETPGLDIQRACGTSLEAAVLLANRIALGHMECGIAGGVDTSSEVPIELKQGLSTTLVKLSRARTMGERFQTLGNLKPQSIGIELPAVKEPRTGLSMGEHCELMAQEWKIPRLDQDELAATSHRNAQKAYEEGFYEDLVTEFQGVSKDNNLRANIALDKMSKLKPAFERSSKGTLTAANSSPLTDGAATVMLASEDWCQKKGIKPQAYLTFSGLAAVNFQHGEGLLMAPAYAVPRMLERAKIKLQDFDFYEIHEAFAAQVLCTLRAWDDESFCKDKVGISGKLGTIDMSKMNIKGGSIALGHPFAATGARILASLAKIIQNNQGGRGLISICTAGGMGVTAIVEGAS